jgi:signal peptidase
MTTPQQTRDRRTPAGVVGDVLLWIAAIGGALCILIVLASVFFHVTLIMFKTGSMEPTIPTGSLAVVREIPASEVAVGDIVTVDRPGKLPITHRVTSVSGSGETRTLTLRGDANPVDDVAPYVVQTVRQTVIWVPGWSSVVIWFSNPLVLGGLTVGATALVTWAFWPRDELHGRRRARRRVASGPRRPSGAAAGSATTVLVVALVVGAAPPPVHAAEVETVVTSAYLQLTSINDPDLMASMTPGNPVFWQIGVAASAPGPGRVHLGLAASGTLTAPGDMTLRVQACTVRWVAGVCSTGPATWLPTTDLAWAASGFNAYGAREVGSIDAADVRWLMLTVTPTRPAPTPGDSAAIRLQAWGVSGLLSTAPNGLALTGTGEGSWFPPSVLAFAAIAGGLLICVAASRRRRSDHA